MMDPVCRPLSVAALLFGLLALPLPAAAAIFDLRTTDPYPEGTIADLEGPSFSITVDGISATLTAIPGVLNQTASGFGVNAPGGGDNAGRIDGGEGIETVVVSFSEAVVLESIELSSFSVGEEGSLVIAGGAPIAVTTGNPDLGSGQPIPAGQSFLLGYVAGNGFSFDRFEVSPAAPVPGLGSWGLRALVLVMGVVGATLLHRPRTGGGTPIR